MIKAIVFDFFGVFCPDTSLEWLKKNPRYVELLPAHQAICDRSDKGEITRAEFYEEESKLTGIAVGDVEKGIDAEFRPNMEVIELARTLHATYKTAVLSNTNVGWVEPYVAQCNIEDCFDEIILSATTGFVKPSREIFELTAKKLGVSIDQMVFIDDRESNVMPAQELGIHGILFRDTETLKHELNELGIKL